MKNRLRKLISIFILVLCSFFVDSYLIKAQEKLEDFFSFEQEIIDINKEDIYLDNQIFQGVEEYVGNVVKESDNENKFILKRLIVQGNLKNDYGSIKKVSYNDLHILCYNSKEETEIAYNKLKEDNSLDILIDGINEIEEYAENDYDYSEYKNWGAEAIDIGGYRRFLVDNNVTKEVVVVVMDTGINTSHPMFNNRLLKDSRGKIKGFAYYDSTYRYSYNNLGFDSDDTNRYSFEDDHGHGAHVAGIICSLTPQNVKILPIKIGGKDGRSTTSIMIAAYLRVINVYSKQYNIVSTNLSYSGGGKESESEKNTFNEKCYKPLMDLNILPVLAAGNESKRINIEGLDAVVVSSIKKVNNEYKFDNSYSNYGNVVDIAAPGTGIYAAGIASSDKADSSIVSKSGTSMATPQVVGVVALLYLNPKLPSNYKAIDIEEMLYEYSLDYGEPNKDIYYGEGILNLKYFEVEKNETLSFYNNGNLITKYVENENFLDSFNLDIKCSNPQFKIIYTTNRALPTFSKHQLFSSPIKVETSLTIYAMGIKVVNNQIVERTKLYKLSYFYKNTTLEECFTVDYRGYLDNYTCNFTKINIPNTMHGMQIKGLSPSLFKDSNIEYITLPDSVETIGGYVFQNAINLKYIYAPGVKKVYIAAFANCDSLKFVSDIHPETNIKEGAYLPSLEETVGSTFSGCDNLETVSLSKLKTLGEIGGDFFENVNLKTIYLPLITSIPQLTFYNCTSLLGEFVIGDNVENIASDAFRGNNLSNFVVNGNSQYFYTDGIGLYSKTSLISYANANKNIDYVVLDTITINGQRYTITEIGESAIINGKLKSLTIPSTIMVLNKFAFSESEIEILYYNASNCTHEGYYEKEEHMRAAVFYKIGTIVIGDTVLSIPERLFQSVYFDELIINSSKTQFQNTSFYRLTEQGDFNKLIFNYKDIISEEYFKNFIENTDLFSYSQVNYLYSKTEIPFIYNTILSYLKYQYIENDYYIYTRIYSEVGKFLINATNGKNGTISPEGETEIEEGKSIVYYITPDVGYHIESINVDGVMLNKDQLDLAARYGYSFNRVDSNHTIHVTFAPNIYNIIYKDEKGNIFENLNPSSYVYGVGTPLPQTVEKEGHTFIGWYELVNSQEHFVKFVTPKDIGDKVYYAKFNAEKFEIVVLQSNNGVISEAKETYDYGENVCFYITPNQGYHISVLLIDGEAVLGSYLNQYTFVNIKKNHIISAIFKANYDTPYLVKHWQQSLSSQNATVIGENYYKLVETNNLLKGTTDSLTNIKSNEYQGFTALPIQQKNISGDGSTCVDVLYNRNTYNVIVTKDIGIESVIGEGAYLYGEKVNLKAELKEGYEFYYWEKNIFNIISENYAQSHSFEMPFTDVEINVYSNIKKYKYYLDVGNNGNIFVSSNVLIDYGSNLEFEIKSNYGYEISQLIINDKDVTEFIFNNKYTESNIKNNLNVKANFELKKYNISSIIQGMGEIQIDNEEIIRHGDNRVVKILAKEGYELEKVVIDGNQLEKEALITIVNEGYLFNNIVDNHQINAIFAKKKYEIKSTVEGNGTIYFENGHFVEHGDNIRLEFKPNEGYVVKEVTINGKKVNANSSYLFTNVIKDHDVKVVFVKETFKITVDIEGNGKIESEMDLDNIDKGEDVLINIIADIGHRIDKIFIDDKQLENTSETINILNIESDVNLVIMFVKDEKAANGKKGFKGMSCSKNKEGNIHDFLFVILTVVGIAFPRKRIFK